LFFGDLLHNVPLVANLRSLVAQVVDLRSYVPLFDMQRKLTT